VTIAIRTPTWTRLDPVLIAIVLASLALKWALAVWAESLVPRADEHQYAVMAERTAELGRVPGVFRPPGYPAFLGAVVAHGGDLGTARRIQALLSALTPLFVYSLSAALGGRALARLASGLVAFDPVLVGFSHLLWSETLYLFLFLAGLALWIRGFAPLRPWRWLGAGALFGAAAYARPQLLTFVPFLLAAAAWRARATQTWRRGALAALALAVGLGCALLPWSAHQWQRRGELVLVSTNGPYNLLVGTDPTALFVDKDDHWSSSWGYLADRRYEQGPALRVAWLRIASRPLLFLRKSLWEAAHLFTLDSFVLRHLRNGWYGEQARAWLPTAVLATGAFSALLTALGFIGLVLMPPSAFRSAAGLALLHALLLFGATFSLSRFAVPLRPLLAVGAAWLALQRGSLDARRIGRGHRLLLAAGLGLLAFSWWSDGPLLWDMLAHGGRHHPFTWLD